MLLVLAAEQGRHLFPSSETRSLYLVTGGEEARQSDTETSGRAAGTQLGLTASTLHVPCRGRGQRPLCPGCWGRPRRGPASRGWGPAPPWCTHSDITTHSSGGTATRRPETPRWPSDHLGGRPRSHGADLCEQTKSVTKCPQVSFKAVKTGTRCSHHGRLLPLRSSRSPRPLAYGPGGCGPGRRAWRTAVPVRRAARGALTGTDSAHGPAQPDRLPGPTREQGARSRQPGGSEKILSNTRSSRLNQDDTGGLDEAFTKKKIE